MKQSTRRSVISLLVGFTAAVGGYQIWDDGKKSLSPDAEPYYTELTKRIARAKPPGSPENWRGDTLNWADRCTASYMADHLGRNERRISLLTTGFLPGQALDEETQHLVSLARSRDTSYLFHVVMNCENRKKPRTFEEWLPG